MAKYTSERGRSWLWKKGEPQKIRHATPVERLLMPRSRSMACAG